jgi:N-acetylneuraminic acid mutarotase
VIANKLYVVGNRYLDVYDPATNVWKTKAAIPTAGNLLYGANLNEKFFVISASYVSAPPYLATKAYWYNPTTNTWSSRAAPPNSKAGPIVKVIINGTSRLFMSTGSGLSYLYTPSRLSSGTPPDRDYESLSGGPRAPAEPADFS